MSAAERLNAIDAEFLNICGACDAGLPMGCACRTRDHRGEMSALVDALRVVLDLHSWRSVRPVNGPAVCAHDGEQYPCTTRRAIDSKLGDAA